MLNTLQLIYMDLNLFMKNKKLVTFLTLVLTIIIVYTILAFIIMYAWNGVIPCIFNLKALTFTQAICLLIVVRIIAMICNTKYDDYKYI